MGALTQFEQRDARIAALQSRLDLQTGQLSDMEKRVAALEGKAVA